MEIGRELLEAPVAVAGAPSRREPVHGLGHGFDVLAEVDPRAVVEEAAPLRIEPPQVQVVGQLPPGLGEDALEHARNREDGRPHVEAEALLVQQGGFSADPAVLVEQRGLVAAGGKHAGGGEAAEPAADNRYRLSVGHGAALIGSAPRPWSSARRPQSEPLGSSAPRRGLHCSRTHTVRSAGRRSCRGGRCR